MTLYIHALTPSLPKLIRRNKAENDFSIIKAQKAKHKNPKNRFADEKEASRHTQTNVYSKIPTLNNTLSKAKTKMFCFVEDDVQKKFASLKLDRKHWKLKLQYLKHHQYLKS